MEQPRTENKNEQKRFESIERAKEIFFATPGVDIDVYGTYQGLDGLKYMSRQQGNDESITWKVGNRQVSVDGTISQTEEGDLTWFDSGESDVSADKRRRDFRDVEGRLMEILHQENVHGDNNFLFFSGQTTEGDFNDGQENLYVGIAAPVMDPNRQGFKACTVSFPIGSEVLRVYAGLNDDDKKSFVLDMWYGSTENDERLMAIDMGAPMVNSLDSIAINNETFDIVEWEKVSSFYET